MIPNIDQVANKQRNARLLLLINGAAILNYELRVVEIPLASQPEIPTSRRGVSDDLVGPKSENPTSEL